jgi:hypothetical protein
MTGSRALIRYDTPASTNAGKVCFLCAERAGREDPSSESQGRVGLDP